MTTTMYAVEGMMCESCMAAVLDNVHSLPGVTEVTMDLVAGGKSPLIVTSRTKLGAEAVRDAIGQVGFDVPRPEGRELREGRLRPATGFGETHPDREPLFSIGGLSS